jgi:Cu-Zn family superoxide dismutase
MKSWGLASALSVLIALSLAACGSAPPPAPAPPPVPSVPRADVQEAQAVLASASGSLVSGKVVLTPVTGGVRLVGEVGGLPKSGRAGFHVHERGDCSSADGSSAGAHFNPTGQPHGNAKTGAHHAGDLDNLIADLEGVARVDVVLRDVSLGGAANSDIAGRALVVHAAPDDYRTQPAGNSGARVACGVIRITRQQPLAPPVTG